MRLPNGTRAVVELEKLRGYCLSRSHPRGRHKARVFVSALGLTDADAGELREALLHAAKNGAAVPVEADDYGQRYVLDFEMIWRARRAIIQAVGSSVTARMSRG